MTKTEPHRIGLADFKAYLGMKHIVHAWRGGLDLRSEMDALMVVGESAKQGLIDLTDIDLVVPLRGQADLATKQEAWTRCQAATQSGREWDELLLDAYRALLPLMSWTRPTRSWLLHDCEHGACEYRKLRHTTEFAADIEPTDPSDEV